MNICSTRMPVGAKVIIADKNGYNHFSGNMGIICEARGNGSLFRVKLCGPYAEHYLKPFSFYYSEIIADYTAWEIFVFTLMKAEYAAGKQKIGNWGFVPPITKKGAEAKH